MAGTVRQADTCFIVCLRIQFKCSEHGVLQFTRNLCIRTSLGGARMYLGGAISVTEKRLGGHVECWKSEKLNIWMKWIGLAFETLLYSKWTSWYLVLWIVNIHITQNYLAFTESFLIINLGSNAKEHVSGFVWPQILPFSLWADDMPSLWTDIGC